jgi:hypothetical protein
MQNTDISTPNDEDFVRRMNETIAIHPQRGRVTLVVRRLFNVLVYFAQQDGPQAKYSRPLSEVMEYIEFSSGATHVIKHHLELMTAGIAVIWNTPGKVAGWGVTAMLAQAELNDGPRGKAKTLEWMFPEKIQSRLFDYKAFTHLSLQIHTSLTSGASVSLFEICSRYETNSRNQKDGTGVTNRADWTWWVPVLTGDAKNTYSEYKYFKRDILKASISEINSQDRATFTVELVEHKNGIRVSDIQFKIVPKPVSENSGFGEINSPLDVELIRRMVAMDIPQDEARAIYQKHERKVIRAALKATDAKAVSTSGKPLVSQAAYFKVMLRSKYKEPKIAVKAAQQAALDLADPEAEMTSLKAAYKAHQITEASGYWKEVGADEATALKDEWLAMDLPKQVRDGITNRVVKSKLAKTAFAEWLAAKLWGEPTAEDLLAFSLKQEKA